MPLEGEIILYTDLSPMGVKIGDGVHTASELEFVGLTSDGYPVIRKNGDLVTTESMEGLAIHPVTYIEPKQAGTGDPSPTNVRAISGWNTITVTRTGKNMLPSLVKGVRIESSTGAELSHASYSTTPYIKYNSNAALYMSGMPVTLNNFIAFYDVNKNFVGRTSGDAVANRIIRPSDTLHNGRKCEEACFIRLCVYATSASSGTIDDIDAAHIQLEFGETATEYESYEAQTITTDFPETVYGGSFDWATGVLTVDSAITNIGSLTVTKTTTEYQTFALTGFAQGLAGSKDTVAAISDTFNGLTQNTISATTDNYMWFSSQTGQLRLKCTSYTDKTAAEFKADFAEAQIVYKIAEPYTIQLTPQQLKALEGTNSVWSNCGSTKAIFNLTPEIVNHEAYNIIQKDEAPIISAHCAEGLAIHPITNIRPMQTGEGSPSPNNVRTISGFN